MRRNISRRSLVDRTALSIDHVQTWRSGLFTCFARITRSSAVELFLMEVARYIGSGSSAPMLAGSSLTVSFWLRVDSQQQGIANIMNWGNASHKRQFAATAEITVVFLPGFWRCYLCPVNWQGFARLQMASCCHHL